MMTARRPLALALGVALFAMAGSGSPGVAAGGPGATGQDRGAGTMARRDGMTAEMMARERRLDDLVTRMQAATGPAKVEAVAAAVAELVAQHKAMHRRMMGRAGASAVPVPDPRPEPPAAPGGAAHDHHASTPDEMCVPEA